jgi:hypothetical protein
MLSDRDLKRLAGVHPLMQTKIADVFQAMDVSMFVVQGVRSTAEQQADFAKVPKVTNCDGVKVKGPHQVHADGYGYAVDCAFVPTKDRPDPFDPAWPWDEYGDAVENEGLIWGGKFLHLGDKDHAELPIQNPKAA